MIQSEKNIYIHETEIKPNSYASLVLGVSLAVVIFCWVLNEIGIFHVGAREMRIGTALSVVGVAAPLAAVLLNKKLLAQPGTKFYVMAGAILYTASVTTLLTFHTMILLLYPMFIVMLYRSKTLGIMAIAGSYLCTVCSPILGYIIGSWEPDFFLELARICTNGTVEIVGAHAAITGISILKIVVYIVLPHMLMVGSCAILTFYVIKLGAAHVQNQQALSNLSHRDALTGLYNRNFFNSVLESDRPDIPGAVLFFDVNGLKALNDRCGHEYGDFLLKRCGESITKVCLTEEENGFRYGGDEFILLLEHADEAKVLEKIEQWKWTLETVNAENKTSGSEVVCSMAVGYACGSMKELNTLVHRADAMMYENKAAQKAGVSRDK